MAKVRKQRRKWDLQSPGTREMVDEIVHGTFMKQGTMVAMTTGFPGAAAPIRADEGRITALDVTPEGAVYGGTSGHAAHQFIGFLHGMTGIAFDLGVVDGATQTVAVCCLRDRFVAAVNGPQGGALVSHPLQPMPFDLIQEWGFGRRSFDTLDPVGDGEPMVHAVASANRKRVVGVTTRHLFRVDVPDGGGGAKVAVVAAVPGQGRLAVDAKKRVLGVDDGASLWSLRLKKGKVKRRAVKLPKAGSWDGVDLRWARDPRHGCLYTADAKGRLYAWDGTSWSGLGRAPLAPVGPMAVTVDGRLFGFCGDGIARMFGCDPPSKKVRDIGVAASVFERRRYGYRFGDAVVGRDGQIVFGEDDEMGHLWLYFPRLRAR